MKGAPLTGSRFLLTLLVLALVLALYIKSFLLPAILFRETASTAGHVFGEPGNLVRMGSKMAFLSLFGPFLLNFAVLANPLLLAGGTLLLLRRAKMAVTCLALAALFALQTFQLLLFPIPEDEGGVNHSYMVHPLAGWYCWFTAILIALILAAYSQFVPERRGSDRVTDSTLNQPDSPSPER